MTMNPGNLGQAVVGKVDHHVFHADEERELDARLMELNGTHTQLPNWAWTDRIVPAGGEQLAVAFGVFGSI